MPAPRLHPKDFLTVKFNTHGTIQLSLSWRDTGVSGWDNEPRTQLPEVKRGPEIFSLPCPMGQRALTNCYRESPYKIKTKALSFKSRTLYCHLLLSNCSDFRTIWRWDRHLSHPLWQPEEKNSCCWNCYCAFWGFWFWLIQMYFSGSFKEHCSKMTTMRLLENWRLRGNVCGDPKYSSRAQRSW